MKMLENLKFFWTKKILQVTNFKFSTSQLNFLFFLNYGMKKCVINEVLLFQQSILPNG